MRDQRDDELKALRRENEMLRAAVGEAGRDVPAVNPLRHQLTEHIDFGLPKKSSNGTRYSLADIIGASPAMVEAIRQARGFARRKSAVTIIGETGTGKELFAQGIHNASSVADKPFVAINCAAIPDTLMEALMMGTVKGAFTGAVDAPGFFEQAAGGTLFLDEINSLSLSLQPKLLRLLQESTVRRLGDNRERPIHCRVICASNEDLFAAAQEGRFRQDLLYRLTTLLLHIPPLRQHREDIPLLLEKFIARFNAEMALNIAGADPAVIALFSGYSWPGNIRELEHTVECAMSVAQSADTTLSLEHIPAIIRSRISQQKSAADPVQPPFGEQALSLNEYLTQCERRYIEDALARNKGIAADAARSLGMSRQNFHNRLRKHGLRQQDPTPDRD